MKNLFLVAILMFISIGLFAQTSTPRSDVRQGAQRARIHDGRVNGDVTRREAHRLNREQRHVRRAERRVKADGEVTAREKARLNHKQNRASRHIRRAKHNELEAKR
jgi:hypothetical protein